MPRRALKQAEGERITLRVPGDVNKRADALVGVLAAEAASQGFGRVTRAVVLKRALMLGLDALEKQYR